VRLSGQCWPGGDPGPLPGSAAVCLDDGVLDNAAGVLIADPARNPDFKPLANGVNVIDDVHVQSLPPRMITRF